jgi:hypothetical protein
MSNGVIQGVSESIFVEAGELVFDRFNPITNTHKRVAVLSGRDSIRVGCHKITREAWELLKKKVDGK